VGLCQWGALGRSRAGQDYERILAAYYPGTRLQRVY
jgi:stage II sporulation protein D